MSFCGDNLDASTEATNILKGVDSRGIVKTVFKLWEIRSAPFVAVRWREI